LLKWAKERGVQELFIPQGNEQEAALVDGITFFLVPTLALLVDHLNGKHRLKTVSPFVRMSTEHEGIDFAEVQRTACGKASTDHCSGWRT